MDLEETVDKPGGWEAVKQQDSKQPGMNDVSLVGYIIMIIIVITSILPHWWGPL